MTTLTTPASAILSAVPISLLKRVEVPPVLALEPAIQHYDWGDPDFIPALLGRPNPARKPHAELWLGAHPQSPSRVTSDPGQTPLNELIASADVEILGRRVAADFQSQLPFLLKVLSAAAPLSIQVHPDRSRAEAGFERENRAGIPVNAGHRNYKDTNHKPELIVALTEFFGVSGFRPLQDIRHQLEAVPELRSLAAEFLEEPRSLQSLYSRLMTMEQGEVDGLLTALIARLEQENSVRPFTRLEREYWILKSDQIYSKGGHRDRGLFSLYLLNLVHLQPGQGLFLPAGVLHAYLEGSGMELMANSNNVIRGGLTPKHVDVSELLQNVSFEEMRPEIISALGRPGAGEHVYPTPAREFELSRIELGDADPHPGRSNHPVEIFIVLSVESGGRVAVTSGGRNWNFGKGEAFLIRSGASYSLEAAGRATLYKATVPALAEAKAGPVPIGHAPGFRGRLPATLSFGTSGLRGLVTDITDLEAYINSRGFLDYLVKTGDSSPGQVVCLGSDLRPSSNGPDRSIVRAVAKAVEDAGFIVENLGALPTPALTFHALQQRRASIMITGSHIPFDRNGIKFNKSTGEVLKEDEPGILEAVQRFRRIEYARAASQSLFLDNGMFRDTKPLRAEDACAARAYLERYEDFFPASSLQGLRIVFYQHSAVGRDLWVELLRQLGAEVIPLGRSESFVPVDTEAITREKLETLQGLADEARQKHGRIDAVVSTDGDSDRPLLTGVDDDGSVCFFGGDLLGIVAADFLGADAAVVPISANDAVDRWAGTRGVTVIKTRIGSPYVIEGMHRAVAGGARRVVGWEANGGFLTASDLERHGRTLKALPTRDAALPLLAALSAANERGLSLVKLFARLPRRFSKAGLIDNFPPETSRRLVQRFSSGLAGAEEVRFADDTTQLRDGSGAVRKATELQAADLDNLRRDLEQHFSPEQGFDRVVRINILDGVRIGFSNGDIAHIRPSGNAPQLRLYAVADSQARADEIAAEGVREPDGLLRRIEAALDGPLPETDLVRRVRKNITLTRELFARGETPEIIGTVAGSKSAQEFWQSTLDASRDHFGCRATLSFLEDLPTNQAFGLLLLWQRLQPHLREDRGSLVAFVFGDGTRSTPFTETDNAQKPAIATFVPARPGNDSRFLSMVELALKYFVPVQQYLRRSGFQGLVVKWGDEIQIPALDLAGSDPLFKDADVVRFVSLREITADDAQNKDWVGVDASGRVTAFIPRRPLEKMAELADRGLVQRREGRLHGGINLGSIAISYAFLDCLLEEFRMEVNDSGADRKVRPALDPEFFTALATAAIEDPVARAEAWDRATAESPEVAALGQRIPDILYRLQRAIRSLEQRQNRKLKMVAMNFEDQYWGDIGQHSRIFEFYMALNHPGPAGDIARAIAGLTGRRDEHGNLLMNSEVSPGYRIRDSVLINARLTGSGTVEDSVLIGTRAKNVEARGGFDVLSTATDLKIETRGGTYRVVSSGPVTAAPAERVTTLFLPSIGASLFRVLETTDLKDRKSTYSVPLPGNPLSFQQAHAEMGALSMETLQKLRGEAEARVLDHNGRGVDPGEPPRGTA